MRSDGRLGRWPSLGAAFAAAFATFLGACRGGDSDPTAALAALDQLAFVPAGECRILGRGGAELRVATSEPLLVDRYEVSRGAWDAWASRSGVGNDEFPAFRDAWPEAAPSWPASGMTLAEGKRFAAARGMRLPSAAEWLRIAAGTRAQPYPWGVSRASAVSNTFELGLARPVPVGTFEQGASPDGIYDLLGNVAEWVEAPLANLGVPDTEPRPLGWAMGGSYATRLAKIHDADMPGRIALAVLDLDPRTRALDVGLRCVAPARAWLRDHAPDLGSNAREREGLRRIGARWGRDAIPVLEALAGEPGAPASLRHLLDGARG
jgi:formylglycine-generating enzyme required for sulfatase activity